jgi:ornithine cyclodeaminase
VNPQALPFVTAAEFDSVVTTADAIAALDAALSTGHATRQSPLRTSTDLGVGHLLYMPASVDGSVGVKLVSVTPGNPAKGLPRIQGLYILFDGATLAPAAVFDAVSLTNSRTSALSAVAVDHLAPPSADTLLVFGTGPQAVAHVRAISSVRTLGEIVLVGHARASADALVEELLAEGFGARSGSPQDVANVDIVACCTTAAEPLFDSSLLRSEATVVAIGSHSPHAREVDSALVATATSVVERRDAAWVEAGDIILAARDGVPPEQAIDADLSELFAHPGLVAPGRPRFFKSVGQGWSDVVVARLAAERLGIIDEVHAK